MQHPLDPEGCCLVGRIAAMGLVGRAAAMVCWSVGLQSSLAVAGCRLAGRGAARVCLSVGLPRSLAVSCTG